MKLLSYSLIFLLILISCKGREDLAEKTIFNQNFKKYSEISAFKDFEKISDTSIYTEKTGDDFRLLHLKKDREMVILFYKVVNRDSLISSSFNYIALDTLNISNLRSSQRFTLGYCQMEGYVDEQIIAVVKDTTGLYMDVARGWLANLETETIEELSNVQEVKCLNEFYEAPLNEPLQPEDFPKQ